MIQQYDHSLVKLFLADGYKVEFFSESVDDWMYTAVPGWIRYYVYRVTDHPEIKSIPIVGGQVQNTIDGLSCVDWIRRYRTTGAGLKEAKDVWDKLIADGQSDWDRATDTSDKDVGFICKVIEVDIVKNQMVIQLETDNYTVGPGFYKLVKI